MAVTLLNPRKIHLGGPLVVDDELVAGAAITPGYLIEMYDVSGANKWRVHASADEVVTLCVALDRPELNKAITDAYAAADLVKAGFLAPGSKFYGVIPSGQDISNGEFLQSNGDGKLKTAGATTATASVARFQSLTNAGAVTADTRIRVQVIG